VNRTPTALVTGGAGFLGSHVAGHLLGTGHRVVVLDDLSGGYRRNIPPGADLCEGSVVDHRLVESLFKQHRFDCVFHLAAYAAEVLSHFIRRHIYMVNLVGSANLINAAVRHDARCFVFTSSIAVYGTGAGWFREDTHPQPAEPYGIAKLAVEHDLRAARETFGLRFVVFRPHNIYGERQNLSDPYRNVIGIFMNQVLRGEPCTVFGDGSQTRAFSYVEDVAPVIAESAAATQAWDGVYNIGAEEVCPVIDLARLVQKALGRDTGIVNLPSRPEGVHIRSDHSKVREVFGARAAVPLEEGIRRMASWARTVTPAPSRPFGALEIEKGLPASWARLSGEKP
jgi:UDP-glucose 4-epimerase